MKAETTRRKAGTLTISCCGCDAVAEVAVEVEVATEPISASVVKVSTRIPSVDDLIPDGWEFCDPWTHLTYCPKCWGSIVGDVYGGADQ